MGNLRDHGHRLLHDATLRRTLVLLLLLGLALAAEIRVLAVDLPRHNEFLLQTAVTAAALLLPFTILAILMRLPLIKGRQRQRFVIRPFGTMSSPSAYDGNAIASLLCREILAWLPQATGDTASRTAGREAPTASFSLGGASVPLDWVWTQLRYLITGKRTFIIDGLLIDSERPLRLRVWTNAGAMTWYESLSDRPFAEALDGAITRLGTAILDSLDPLLGARIHHGRLHYDEAIHLMLSQDLSPTLQLKAVEMSLDGDYLTQGQRMLEQLESRARITGEVAADLYRLKAEQMTRRGGYEEARDLLLRALHHRKCRRERVPSLLLKLGDTFAYQHDHAAAIRSYGEAHDRAKAELRRMTGESTVPRDILNRRLLGKAKDDVADMLWVLMDILTNRAQCWKVLGETGHSLEDLHEAEVAVDVIRALEVVPSAEAAIQAAQIMKAALHHLEGVSEEAFRQTANRAVTLYDDAIELLRQSLEQAEDDLQGRINLAWCHYGKASCLLRILRVRLGGEEPGALAEAAEQLTRMFRSISETSQRPFLTQFEHARKTARENPGRYAQHLQQAAAIMTEGLVTELTPADLRARLRELLGLEAARAEQNEVIVAGRLMPAALSEAAEEKARQAGMDTTEIQRLHRVTVQLLKALTSHEDPDEADKWLELAEPLIELDQSLQRCQALFGEFSTNASKRLRAEAWYGNACLHAIRNRAAQAADALRAAGEAAGEESVAYRNRAVLDEDFESIRDAPEFTEALTRAGPASIPKRAGSLLATACP